MEDKFVHLHVHSEYSVADAMIKPKQLAKRLKKLGMTKVAITDHGTMFNVPEIYKTLKEYKEKDKVTGKEEYYPIDMIIGCEVYVAPRSNTDKDPGLDNANYHLILLCENNEGYHNLIKIVSNGAENVYYKPRTDCHRLQEWHSGIIALSACIGGEVQEKILNGYVKVKDDEGKVIAMNIQPNFQACFYEATEAALKYESIFGKGNFFLELQDHGMMEQKVVNEALIELSKNTGIPLVVTNDCHYITPEDYDAHDALMAIQAKTTIDSDKRKKYPSDQFYVKSAVEMEDLFPHQLEAIRNTVKIAERCHVDIDFDSYKLPPFDAPSAYNGDNKQFFLDLLEEGMKRRYQIVTPDIQDRMNYEVQTISNMGFVNYFLIIWDVIRYCNEGTLNYGDAPLQYWDKIPVGPGRGSAAGSIVAYALGITKVDPIKYGLLFERFLDPSRISMPDIDTDFANSRRQEVIEYIRAKYGVACTCQIITFSRIGARSGVKAVGRALGSPYDFVDRISKMIPMEPGMTIEIALEANVDLATLYTSDTSVQNLLDIAMALEDVPIYTSTHASGVLVTGKGGITEHAPIFIRDGDIVVQYDMRILEVLNLLKLDILGLKTLDMTNNAVKFIKEKRNIDIDEDWVYTIPDLKPFELMCSGKTDAIFQVEAAGMTDFFQKLKPTNIEDVTAGISLYR